MLMMIRIFTTVASLFMCMQTGELNGQNLDATGEEFQSELRARIAQLSEEIGKNSEDTGAFFRRARLLQSVAEYSDALSDLNRIIELEPEAVVAWDLRGDVHFKMGSFGKSAEDFDRAVELEPRLGPGHWKRGISYYYAGRFEDGRRQFEGYQQVDDNDVENAVWRYLCMARLSGPAAAREKMLSIKKDRRIPMMKIHDLYRGRATVEDVLAEVESQNPSADEQNIRRFYAHLYLGLYYETEGKPELALQHVSKAAADHRIEHYMWDVARVHADVLRKLLADDNRQN